MQTNKTPTYIGESTTYIIIIIRYKYYVNCVIYKKQLERGINQQKNWKISQKGLL